mgnify:FL=1
MLDLQEIRGKIDDTDAEILRLFEKRMKLAEDVAAYKIQAGKPVFDGKREAEKLKKLREAASTPFNALSVQELFQHIIAVSRIRQYQLLAQQGAGVGEEENYRQVDRLSTENARVVFQGVEGAYSFAAMKRFFGENIRSSHVETWKEAMEQTAAGAVDYAVLPIENSTAGSVLDIYDLLTEYPAYIVGEEILEIRHTLMGVPGASLEDIRTVYSHPQGLYQCRHFLEQHPDWKQKKMLNTAMAAEKVAAEADKSQAAIASRYAAEHFGLQILKEDGLAGEGNSTRFVILSSRKCFVRDAGKFSICVELPHKCGSLYGILAHFDYNNLNMTKIESRPIPSRPWEYRFFIDFEGNLSDPPVKNALLGVRSEAVSLRLLGNY